MILLDTNVISQTMSPNGSPAVRIWLDAHPASAFFLCTPVLAELRYGVERLPPGERRNAFDAACMKIEATFAKRLLPFSSSAAHHYGMFRAQRHREGRSVAPVDLMIAAIAVTHRLDVATRNTQDFDGLGLTLINPFEYSPT